METKIFEFQVADSASKVHKVLGLTPSHAKFLDGYYVNLVYYGEGNFKFYGMTQGGRYLEYDVVVERNKITYSGEVRYEYGVIFDAEIYNLPIVKELIDFYKRDKKTLIDLMDKNNLWKKVLDEKDVSLLLNALEQ